MWSAWCVKVSSEIRLKEEQGEPQPGCTIPFQGMIELLNDLLGLGVIEGSDEVSAPARSSSHG